MGRDPATIERSRQMIVVLNESSRGLTNKMREAQKRFALMGCFLLETGER